MRTLEEHRRDNSPAAALERLATDVRSPEYRPEPRPLPPPHVHRYSRYTHTCSCGKHGKV